MYYYEIDTHKIIFGPNILPHEEEYKEIQRLLFLGNQSDMDKYNKWGVTHFETVTNGHVANLAYNKETDTWYCWSHRGHGAFYPGKEVKADTVLAAYFAAGYKPETSAHCKVMAIAFQDALD